MEPFAGSLAVLLARRHPTGQETVNDLDAYVANFWRAITASPDAVAQWADSPISEVDLHARHRWLVAQHAAGFREQLMYDPCYYDEQIAGWWAWGISQWIGGDWCRGTGSGVPPRKRPRLDRGRRGVTRQSGEGLRRWLQALARRLRAVRVCCGDWRRVLGPAVTTGVGGPLQRGPGVGRPRRAGMVPRAWRGLAPPHCALWLCR